MIVMYIRKLVGWLINFVIDSFSIGFWFVRDSWFQQGKILCMFIQIEIRNIAGIVVHVNEISLENLNFSFDATLVM